MSRCYLVYAYHVTCHLSAPFTTSLTLQWIMEAGFWVFRAYENWAPRWLFNALRKVSLQCRPSNQSRPAQSGSRNHTYLRLPLLVSAFCYIAAKD